MCYYDDRREVFVTIKLKFTPSWLMTWCGGWVMLPENVVDFKPTTYPLVNPISSTTYNIKPLQPDIWCQTVFTMESTIYMVGINRNSTRKLSVYKLD